MRDSWIIYLGMYCTLEYAYEQQEAPNECLREFLGDANPFIWADKGSADPAVWAEYEAAFLDRFADGAASDEDSLDFVQNYLAEKGAYYETVFPGDASTSFVKLFDDETTLTEWARVLDVIERQEREARQEQ